MKKTFQAKKYIIDQLIQLVINGVMAIGICYGAADYIWVICVLESLIVFISISSLSRILFFSLDLLCGYVEKDVCFSRMCNIDGYEFFKKSIFVNGIFIILQREH